MIPQLKQARKKLKSTIESYKTIYTEEFSGLYALCLNENGITKKVPVNLNGDNVRIRLTSRHPELQQLRNRYISNKIKI